MRMKERRHHVETHWFAQALMYTNAAADEETWVCDTQLVPSTPFASDGGRFVKNPSAEASLAWPRWWLYRCACICAYFTRYLLAWQLTLYRSSRSLPLVREIHICLPPPCGSKATRWRSRLWFRRHKRLCIRFSKTGKRRNRLPLMRYARRWRGDINGQKARCCSTTSSNKVLTGLIPSCLLALGANETRVVDARLLWVQVFNDEATFSIKIKNQERAALRWDKCQKDGTAELLNTFKAALKDSRQACASIVNFPRNAVPTCVFAHPGGVEAPCSPRGSFKNF